MKKEYDYTNCFGEYQLFAGQFAQKYVNIKKEQAKNTTEGITYRIPSLLSVKDEDGETIISMLDTSESGGDFGRIQSVIRRSTDGGKTFGEMETVLSLPVSKAPQDRNEYHSAFSIDPILVRCGNGDILMIVDMYPECKGLMHRQWLDKQESYKKIDGKFYLTLHSAKSKVGKGRHSGRDEVYTVRENGWVYSPDGKKTNYYIPQNHNPGYAFETMGDLYFAVGTPDYIDSYPPLLPGDEGSDIYCGNIYLSEGKGSFNLNNPEKVAKRIVSPEGKGDLYSKYKCVETKPAPLSATIKNYLWVLRSTDNGKTWSQPVDISGGIINKNEVFVGTGPGVAICLENQKDKSKNGRILAPVYSVKQTSVIFSDDNGHTWKRSKSSENIDETQLVELSDGTILCFGRQRKLGKTPFSISVDGGETWTKRPKTNLSAVKCQKAVIRIPKSCYVDGMDKSCDYIIASNTSGWYQKNSKRFGGIVTLGKVNEDKSVSWLTQRKIHADDVSGEFENFYAYSSLTVLKNKNIGLMYEALPSGFVVYEEFSLEWLINGEKAFSFPIKRFFK